MVSVSDSYTVTYWGCTLNHGQLESKTQDGVIATSRFCEMSSSRVPPRSTARNGTKPCALASFLSIRAFFVVLSIVQVSLCAILVGYLGYHNAVDITNRLSHDIADERFHRVRAAVDGSLQPLLQSLDGLHGWMYSEASMISVTNTVVNMSGFWHYALHDIRKNQDWNVPLSYSYACAIGLNTMAVVQQDQPAQVMLLVADSTIPTGYAQSAQMALPPIDQLNATWDAIPSDVDRNASFQSLREAGRLGQPAQFRYQSTTRPWYIEATRHKCNKVWTAPMASVDGQYFLGAAQGIYLPASFNINQNDGNSSAHPVVGCLLYTSPSPRD